MVLRIVFELGFDRSCAEAHGFWPTVAKKILKLMTYDVVKNGVVYIRYDNEEIVWDGASGTKRVFFIANPDGDQAIMSQFVWAGMCDGWTVHVETI